MMESQNELKGLMSEAAALQEGIDQINEQLRRPNPIRVNCLEQMDLVLVNTKIFHLIIIRTVIGTSITNIKICHLNFIYSKKSID